MRPSPIAAKVRAFNDELRRAIAKARELKRKTQREGRRRREKGGGSKRKPRGPVWVPGSGDAGVVVELSDGHSGQGDTGECPKPKRAGDTFAHLQYLTCRCRRGDQGACRAANALQAAQRKAQKAANSGGGGGGGW